jgi:hypothetical protein
MFDGGLLTSGWQAVSPDRRARCGAVHTGTDRRLGGVQNRDPETATGEHGTVDLAQLRPQSVCSAGTS